MFLSKKSSIALVLICVVVGGLILPAVAHAGLGEWILRGFIKAIMYILVGLTSLLADLMGALLGWIMNPANIGMGFTPGHKNVAVDMGWAICRDLANMAVVLGFVLVGIATILRIRDYEAQKLLAPLIVVAILINFSPVICGLMIDASNITMDAFLRAGATSQLTTPFKAQWAAIDKDALSALDTLTIGLGFVFMNLVVIPAFGLLFFLLAARYVVLWFLVIFSPLAFVCYIFGFSKKYFSQWWEQFTKWCLMGIPAAFAIYIANRIAGSALIGAVTDPNGAVAGNFAQKLFPGITLIVGFIVTLKFSGAGAAIAKGAALATGGFVLGAIRGAVTGGGKGAGASLGKALGNRVKDSAPARSLSAGTGRMMERIGLRKAGTTAMKQQELNKGSEARLKAMSTEELKDLAGGKGVHSVANRRDRILATKALAEKGDLSGIDKRVLRSNTDRAKDYGIDSSSFKKADPALKIGSRRKGGTAYELDALSHTIEHAGRRDRHNMIANASGQEVIGAVKEDKLDDFLDKASPEQKKKLYDQVTGDNAIHITAHMTMLQKKSADAHAAGDSETGAAFDKSYKDYTKNVGRIRDDRRANPQWKHEPFQKKTVVSKVVGTAGRVAGVASGTYDNPKNVARKVAGKAAAPFVAVGRAAKETKEAAKERSKQLLEKFKKEYGKGHDDATNPKLKH